MFAKRTLEFAERLKELERRDKNVESCEGRIGDYEGEVIILNCLVVFGYKTRCMRFSTEQVHAPMCKEVNYCKNSIVQPLSPFELDRFRPKRL